MASFSLSLQFRPIALVSLNHTSLILNHLSLLLAITGHCLALARSISNHSIPEKEGDFEGKWDMPVEAQYSNIESWMQKWSSIRKNRMDKEDIHYICNLQLSNESNEVTSWEKGKNGQTSSLSHLAPLSHWSEMKREYGEWREWMTPSIHPHNNSWSGERMEEEKAWVRRGGGEKSNYHWVMEEKRRKR